MAIQVLTGVSCLMLFHLLVVHEKLRAVLTRKIPRLSMIPLDVRGMRLFRLTDVAALLAFLFLVVLSVTLHVRLPTGFVLQKIAAKFARYAFHLAMGQLHVTSEVVGVLHDFRANFTFQLRRAVNSSDVVIHSILRSKAAFAMRTFQTLATCQFLFLFVKSHMRLVLALLREHFGANIADERFSREDVTAADMSLEKGNVDVCSFAGVALETSVRVDFVHWHVHSQGIGGRELFAAAVTYRQDTFPLVDFLNVMHEIMIGVEGFVGTNAALELLRICVRFDVLEKPGTLVECLSTALQEAKLVVAGMRRAEVLVDLAEC